MTLVVLCGLPLIAPHVALYREQKELVRKVKIDQQVQNWFAQYYEELLQGRAEITEEKREAFPGAVFWAEEKKKKGEKNTAHLIEIKVQADGQLFNYQIAAKHEEKTEKNHTP